VTGASRGLGAAAAKRLASDGFLVVVNFNKSMKEGEEVVRSIRDLGGNAELVQGDISTVKGVDSFLAGVDAVLEAGGLEPRFDVLVANAGILISKPLAETTEADFDALFNANVKGVFFLVQRSLRRIRDNGRIITLSSGLSRYANPMFAAYSATKGAVDVMTRVFAQDLGGRGITVNAVAPGAIDTDMNASWIRSKEGREQQISRQAVKRIATAADIADVVSFLAGGDSRWVTGQRLEASGGSKL
jgi:NAD(P)-dependent dehydrogenase (short-subunit alcohol dehydrogenase family)